MPENNGFQELLIKNLCGPMNSESWQKSTKRNIRNISSLLKCWLDKQEVASSVITGTSFLFLFFVFLLTMMGPRFTE